MPRDAPLSRYRAKRDFAATPEPGGARPAAARGRALAYVVQRHQARRLHYDFRLEIGGVLASWAVPKGPSLDPAVKRLAVHVEDHPLEYGRFEGDIPAGHYGAGHVDIWDSGRWKPQGDPRRGLEQGKLHFELEGGRLAGGWVLVRTGSGDKQWLLRKLDDAYARPGHDAEAEADADANTDADTGPARPAGKASATRGRRARAALPERIAPQLATLVDRPPPGPGWAYEIKYDGYRILCRLDGDRVRLVSRNGLDWTSRMARLARGIARLKLGSGWLDGEVVVLDERGQSSFQALQAALDGDSAQLRYMVFDLPFWDGEDLRPRPLAQRQQALARLLETLPGEAPVALSQALAVHSEGDGEAAWHEACRLGWEGLVGKRLDAPYCAGRSAQWVKLKCRPRQEFIIGGYSSPTGSRAHLGSLLLGLRDAQGKLVYAGRVGTGFSAQALRDLHRRLQPLRTDRCPFAAEPPATTRYRAGHGRTQVQWVRPELVAEVHFTGWTQDNLVRQASFQGLREDKPARAVREETPVPAGELARPARGRRTASAAAPTARKPAKEAPPAGDTVAGVRISHPSRPVFSVPKVSKLELARYYEAVGPAILPQLRGRRVALLRCPEGSGSPCFFQKHLAEGRLAGLREDGPHIVVERIEGLIALVQRGVIEFHTWGSTLPRADRPDRITLDLDPDPALPWTEVVEAARLTRTLVESLGLKAFLKTTGGKGLHVVAPLRATRDWDTVRGFCKDIAGYLTRFAPDRFTANMSKARRKGVIFVDYLRNGEGATAIAAYSARARQGAPVAVPIAWDELGPRRDLRYDAFNLANAPARAAGPDPWADYAASRRAVTRAMRQAVAPAAGAGRKTEPS